MGMPASPASGRGYGPALGLRPSLARLALMLAVASLTVLVLAAPQDSGETPEDRVLCDECHDDFQPFAFSVNAPVEVPVGEPFPLRLTMRNQGDHQLTGTFVLVGMDLDQNLVLEDGEPWTEERDESGSVGFRQADEVYHEVGYGAVGARFRLDTSVGLLDYVSLTVMGPDGGHWATGGRGQGSQQISLDADDMAEGGMGQYTVVINHEQGLRPVQYDLSIEIEYGPTLGYQEGPDLAPGESHTFTFDMVGRARGPGAASLAVEATCYYDHGGTDHDERLFHEESLVAIEVGDEFVRGGGSDGGGGGGSSSILPAGQALGFLSAILLAASLVTSGLLPRLPRRTGPHCLLSKALALVFIVHWLTLWAGPYGGTLGGIGTGSVMLVLIMVLALGGVRPKLLEGRVMGWSNRVIHRNLTYALVLVLVVHVVLNGSHFAVLRGG